MIQIYFLLRILMSKLTNRLFYLKLLSISLPSIYLMIGLLQLSALYYPYTIKQLYTLT